MLPSHAKCLLTLSGSSSGREPDSHRLRGILESPANVPGAPTTTWSTWGARMGEALEEEEEGFDSKTRIITRTPV